MPLRPGDRQRPAVPGETNSSDGNGEAAPGAAASSGAAARDSRTTAGPVTESGRTDPPRDGSTARERHPYHPKAWALWNHPRRVIVFLFVMEALTIGIFVLALLASTVPGGKDWIRFAILALGTTIHIQLTQRQEERRRAGTRTVLIDLTAVWVFPAVLILPAPLTLLLLALIRAQRWFIARRPAHTFMFASLSHGAAAVLAHFAFISQGPRIWESLTALGSLREFAMVLLAGVVYEGVQVIYVSGILALGMSSRPKLRNILGSKADNLLEFITTGLGAITAILLITMPPTVAIMAVVTVVFNRLAELDQLQDDARTDPKTGVLNMRGWSESAERAVARASRSNAHLAVLMIDLDHFKWINDTFGHPAGDDVLRNVAQVLDEVTRPSDVVGRFGGEEFLVLLPDADPTAAELTAERVRTSIAELRIVTTDKRGARTTIAERTTSIGVAVFPEHADSVDALLQAADAAVYEAKESGRNRVRLTSGPHQPRQDAAEPDHTRSTQP